MDQLGQGVALTPLESMRIDRVMNMLPKSAHSVLEIGPRYGAVTRRLAATFNDVTALDLQKPSFNINRVTPVQGDVQNLQFPNNSFDCVVCTEVLEHVPDFAAGAREIVRVAKSHVLIGVPFRQDTRVGRTTCIECGKISPPYGHLNSFGQKDLERMFQGVQLSASEYLAKTKERTNFLSVWLQDFAQNPYGAYYDDGNCVHCRASLARPKRGSFMRRAAGALGLRLQNLQSTCSRARPTWILALFEKNLQGTQ